MRGRRKLATLLGAILLVTACGGSGEAGGGSGAGFESITLNVGTLYGPEQWQVTPLQAYADAVTEASEGRIDFQFHHSGSLAAPDEMASALQSGLLDLAHIVPVYTPESFPIDNWISQAGFLANSGPPAGALEASAATLDWAFSNEEVLQEFTDAGLRPLLPRFMLLESYDLLCRERPVVTQADVSGQRVRVGGPTWIAEAEAVGLVPEVIAGAEMYEAFQRGIVDCIMGAPPDLIGQSFWDIGRHYTDASFSGFSSYGVFLSEQRWQSLPVEVQQILWDSLPVYWEELFVNVLEEQRRWVTEGQERGITFHIPAPELSEELANYQASVLKSLPDTAPPSVSDPEALVQDLISRHDQWAATVTEDLGVPSNGSWEEWVLGSDGLPDVGAWADRVVAEILDEHRPQGG